MTNGNKKGVRCIVSLKKMMIQLFSHDPCVCGILIVGGNSTTTHFHYIVLVSSFSSVSSSILLL